MREDAAAAGIGATTFALHDADNAGTSADVVAWPADPAHASFHIADGDQALGDYHLSIDGDFNYLNAAAAIAIAHAAGVSLDDAGALHAIESVRIAGRMEQFRDPQSNTLAIVDYAHNYASVTALLDFVYERWGEENPRITLVTGSAGNKAYDRRKEIVEAAEAAPAEEVLVKPKRTRRKKVEVESAPEAIADIPVEAASAEPVAEPEAAPEAVATVAEPEDAPAEDDTPAAPPRRGWWQRTFGE